MKYKICFLAFYCYLGISTACTEQKSMPVEPSGTQIGGPANNISFLANHYFSTYASRSNWDEFLALYHDSVNFQDVMLRYDLQGKKAFMDFYNWSDTSFSKHPDYPETMVLEALAITDSSAVGSGYFTPFYYLGELFDMDKHMKFTIWLYFDTKGKIVRQEDYIVYPPKHLKAIAEGFLDTEKK